MNCAQLNPALDEASRYVLLGKVEELLPTELAMVKAFMDEHLH